MGLDSQLHKVSAQARNRYLADKPIVDAFRKHGHDLREQVKQDPVRNGMLLTRDCCDAEIGVIKELCPDVEAHDAKVRLKAWYWVLRQDWGKDLRASPYEQRYFNGKFTDAA